ncbi:sulfur carrier protein ThiS [Pontibacterium sp. N1Y112]|jgi:sulfur carrier protein|uniref:Sulfur carrier protein ThiS n=1 Tax=Pontibacterium sinense TaxID=2781979 RepID=A0A8J7FGS7_9GAMM|nr:sulfur carrier protein ThiS [Pontibacterium sinense]MBE9395713.1 sulfur carrier protein ThiS [Pontibacterium sinense]
MQINLNGESLDVRDGASLIDLVEQLGLTGKRIAIELNMEIIPRSEHPSTMLAQNDTVEIVNAIGGG